MHRRIKVNNISLGNDLPLVLFAGVNVLESYDLAAEVCETIQTLSNKLQIPFIFKASFDKANRSAISSFRGPGLERGLDILLRLKNSYQVPILTDVHEPHQAPLAAAVVDIIQLPAFLSRQTDLVEAMARTNCIVNIKKAQFLAPHEMQYILQKFEYFGNQRLILCERGTMFGYNNLIVDMLGFPILKSFGYPVIFDVTHALQLPGAAQGKAGGRGSVVADLARSAVAQGLAGLFVEMHPNPQQAKCDGPSALALENLEDFLVQVIAFDKLAKKVNTNKEVTLESTD